MAVKGDTAELAPPVLRFRLPPDPARLLRARERIRDYLHHYCGEQKTIDELLLCIEEASTNVIRHSQADEDLDISLWFEGEDLIGVVKDRGCGFDVTGFDPRAQPNADDEGGRGLFLMAALADDLRLRCDEGLEVRLTKRAVARRDGLTPDSGFEAGGSRHWTASRRTRTLLQDISEAFVALDWDYRCVYANPSAARLASVSPEELLLRRFWDLYPHAAETALGKAVRAAMELGRSSIVEYPTKFRGWHETRVYPTTTGVSLFTRGIGERKRVEAEREQLLARTSLLGDVALAAASSLDLEEICSATLRAVQEHVGMAAGNVWILDGERGLLRQLATRGYPPDMAANLASIALDDKSVSAARLVAGNHDVLTQHGADASDETIERARSLGAASWIALPIRHDGRTLGCLELLFAGDLRFSGRELDVYQSVAGTLGTALANAGLHQARRESEERFRALFEAMSQSAALNELVLDEDGKAIDVRFLMVNPAFERQTGTTAADVVGRTSREIFGIDYPLRVDRFAEVVRSGEPTHFEEFVAPLDRWMEIRAYRTREERFAVLSTDISERKLAEDALQTSEERLRLAVGAGHIGLYEWDSVSGATYWNGEMYRLMGLDRAVAIDMERWLSCVHPDDQAEREESFSQATGIQGAGVTLHDEYRVVHPDGHVHWIESFSTVERDEDRLVIRGAANDVTERKRAEEERERSLAELQQGVLTTLGSRRRSPTLAGPGWAWLLLPLSALAIVVFKAAGLQQAFNSADLFTALNVAFLTAIPLLIALLAAHSYFADGSPTLLFLGCGTLVLALGALLAPLQAGGAGPNGIVTVYNTAALLAALCHLAGVALPSSGRLRPRLARLVFAYLAAAAVVLLLCLLSRWNVLPTFFVPERGALPVDWVVLYLAAAGFGLTVLLLRLRPDGGSTFCSWYALGLALIAAGLVAVSLQLVLGDPLNWTGRVLQYFGSVCLLLAVLPSLHRGSWGLPLGRAMREASDRYRALVEVSPEAILVVADDRILFANPAAEGMLASAAGDELVGGSFSALLHSGSPPIPEDTAAGEIYGGSPCEVKLRRMDGRVVDAELRSVAVEFGGLPAAQYVAHDISDRRASEQERERLRQLELETQRDIATTLQRTSSIRCRTSPAGGWPWRGSRRAPTR